MGSAICFKGILFTGKKKLMLSVFQTPFKACKFGVEADENHTNTQNHPEITMNSTHSRKHYRFKT
jgi:hypothetical protein